MAPAAKASQPDYTGVTVYVAKDIWLQLRRSGMDDETTASALAAALMELYVAGQISEAADVRARAQEITQGRRRRSD
jgi:hypothetical protein